MSIAEELQALVIPVTSTSGAVYPFAEELFALLFDTPDGSPGVVTALEEAECMCLGDSLEERCARCAALRRVEEALGHE